MAAPRKCLEERRERGVRLAADARRDPATRTGALRRIGEHLWIDPQTLRNGVTQAEIDSGPRLEAAEPERRRVTAAVESTVLAELAGPEAAQPLGFRPSHHPA